MRIARACALAGLLAAAAAAAEAQDPQQPQSPLERYTVTGWTVDDGLPHNQVHDIRQAPDGFVWVATWEGVARFDGRDFRPLGGGRRQAARKLLRDGDDMLVGGILGGLWRYPPGGAGIDICPGHPRLDVWGLARASDELLWVLTSDGLYRADGAGRCAPEAGAAALRGQPLLALLPRADGSLWIGGLRGLYRYRDGQLEELGAAMGLPAGAVRALADVGDGATWIVGDHGVWRHAGHRLRRLHPEQAEGLLHDRSGAQWVVTSAGQVLRHRAGAWEQLDARHGLRGRATGAIFEDREGLVWVGTTHGLFRIFDGPVWAVGRRQGLVNDYVRSILQTGDGQVWIGHAGGLSRRRDGRLERVYPDSDDDEGSSVLALARASDGGVWIGTYNRGVLHVGPEPSAPVQPLTVGRELPAISVRALLEDADGSLWIGSERGVSRWWPGDLVPEPLPGLPALPVRSFHPAPDGHLWIGFLGGLAVRAPDGTLRTFAADGDFPASAAFDFLSDADGTLWIASDRGVLRRRGDRFVRYGDDRGIPASTLFRILDDGLGNLWFSSNRGVFRVPRDSFAQVDRGERRWLELELFAREDGMPSGQANGGSAPAGWRLDDGSLWIPTASGVAVLEPARARDGQAQPVPLVIDRVTADGRELLAGADGFVVPSAARLVVDYAGTSLRRPHNLRYRYRLRGFDRDWIEAGEARSAAYTNLPPGELYFDVQVARAPVDWSSVTGMTSARLRIDAPWWRWPWVLALAGLALMLLPVAIHLALGRHQRARQQRLERLVQHRTRELRQKNRQLEAATRQLEYQASHDPLTGLPNRRAGDLALRDAVARARAGTRGLCVAVVDVDRFKAINDRYGHQAGDQVLERVAVRLREALAGGGDEIFVSRLGGEEFLVLMPGYALADAVALLDVARRGVAAADLATLDGSPLSCTISIGVVAASPQATPDSLLQRADALLYEAKRRGRDRIVAEQGQEDPHPPVPPARE